MGDEGHAMSQEGGGALGLGHVIDNSLQQLAKLGFLACIIAWGLTSASKAQSSTAVLIQHAGQGIDGYLSTSLAVSKTAAL